MTSEVRDTARSTYDALLWELREQGLPRLNHDAALERLSQLSIEQIDELVETLSRLRPRYDAITDDLIQVLREQQ
jgi:hypothetical protein